MSILEEYLFDKSYETRTFLCCLRYNMLDNYPYWFSVTDDCKGIKVTRREDNEYLGIISLKE